MSRYSVTKAGGIAERLRKVNTGCPMSNDAAEVLRHRQTTCSADADGVSATSPRVESSNAPAGRGTMLALIGAVAGTVFGSRLIVIFAFGSPVPVLDQWDAEGTAVYSRYLKGTLSLADLIASHNGHRIFVSRLLALGHLELAGEWNTRLEMILGAAVLTLLITWLVALLMPLVAPQRRLLLACFIALIFAFPIDFENTLWGFQSQVYLSLLLGLAALVAFAAAPAFSLRWFGGLAAAVLGYFTFATGLAILPAAGLVVSLQLAVNTRKRSAREVAAVGVLAAVTVGMALWGAHSTKTMSTLGTFVQGLGIFAVLTAAGAIPIVGYWRLILAKRPEVSDRAWVVLGVSGWVAIQLVLFAYGRGAVVAPRYLDVVLLVYPVAFVAVFALRDRTGRVSGDQRTGRGPVLWVVAVAAAFTVAGSVSVVACSYWRNAADQEVADVRAYLATGDINRLKERGRPNHGVTLKHPYPERQAAVLDDPQVRAILPPEIRPGAADNRIARNRLLLRGRAAPATATAVRLVLASGPAFLALGIGLFLAVATARTSVRQRGRAAQASSAGA